MKRVALRDVGRTLAMTVPLLCAGFLVSCSDGGEFVEAAESIDSFDSDVGLVQAVWMGEAPDLDLCTVVGAFDVDMPSDLVAEGYPCWPVGDLQDWPVVPGDAAFFVDVGTAPVQAFVALGVEGMQGDLACGDIQGQTATVEEHWEVFYGVIDAHECGDKYEFVFEADGTPQRVTTGVR
jgi:hypothetical protein